MPCETKKETQNNKKETHFHVSVEKEEKENAWATCEGKKNVRLSTRTTWCGMLQSRA